MLFSVKQITQVMKMKGSSLITGFILLYSLFLTVLTADAIAPSAEAMWDSSNHPAPRMILKPHSPSHVVHLSSAPYKLIQPQDSLFIYGGPYHEITNGKYTLQKDKVNGYPVYQKEGGGYTWSFYQRSDNKWYLDFDTPDEGWSGTVMYSTSAGHSPELLEYNDRGAVSAFSSLELRNFPYCNGMYTLQSTLYNNRPVYQCSDNHAYHLYRRKDGKWYVDFNDIAEDWGGTVAYTMKSSVVPYGVEWNS